MSVSGPQPSPGGFDSLARVLAIPAAVFLAGIGCLALVAALMIVPSPGVLVVAGEDEQGPGTEGEPAPEPAPAPEKEEPATGRDEAEAVPRPAPPESYNGASTVFEPFLVRVETAYTDTTITDGMGSSDVAPPGMEFHIYRLNVTNQGTGPAVFDTYGTTGTTTEGLEYVNDIDAEITVAWDYYWDEINPGETVTTHILFLAPEGTEFAEVRVGGHGLLEPR